MVSSALVTALTCDNPPSLCHSEGGSAKISECFGCCPFVRTALREVYLEDEETTSHYQRDNA